MKADFSKMLIGILSLIIAVMPAHGDGTHPQGITLDGTTGTAGKRSLPGPDYEIKAEYGDQSGQNLFHSFGQFNLHAGERAIFTGPDSVKNIISRVTGGEPSWIDGILRSEIPAANLYLLNPSGLMFGPNAAIDIGGSFHVGTADYLRMGENDCFFTMTHEGEVLSAAEPSAFGFLDHEIAPITFEGRGEITEAEWLANPTGIHVAEGKNISVIGGDIDIKKGTFFNIPKADENGEVVSDENGNPEMMSINPGTLNAPGGRIDMVSAASPGEISLINSGIDTSSCRTLGNISFSDNSLINVSEISAEGQGSGDIYIRGGNFFLNNSAVEAETYGNTDGGVTDIQADTISLNGSYISGNSYGTGKGGDIFITAARSVNLFGNDAYGQGSAVIAYGSTGDSGNISIQTEKLSLNQGAEISTASFGTENKSGNAGTVLIETKNLSLNGGAQIASISNGGGQGGDIIIHASESLSFAGNTWDGFGSSMVTRTSGSGKAGDVFAETGKLSLNDGAWIGTYTEGKGKGGNVTLRASDSLRLSGSTPDGYPSIIAVSSLSNEPDAGDAGDIFIESGKISLSDRGAISGEAFNAGGGKITIRSDEALRLSDSRISTTVKGGADNAGDIGIAEPEFVTLNHSEIIAKAYEGKGGNIHIAAEQFLRSSDSEINASSELGIDGSVNIESPDTDIIKELDILPGNFLDAVSFPPCSVEGKFVLSGKDAVSTAFDDWLASPPIFDGSESEHFYCKGDFENILKSPQPSITDGNAAAYLTAACQASGHHRRALSVLENMLPDMEKSNDAYSKALFFSTLGDLYLSLGDKNQAETYLEKGVEQARLSKDAYMQATVLNNRGNFFGVYEFHFIAVKYYEESLALIESSVCRAGEARQNPRCLLKSKVLINRLRTKFMGNEYMDSVEETETVLNHILSLPDSRGKAEDLISLGLLAREILSDSSSRKEETKKSIRDIAYTALNTAAQIAESLPENRIASYAYGYLGHAHESEGDYAEAFQQTRRALFFAQNYPEILYRWHWQAARVLSAQGNMEGAVKAYNEAVSALNPIRREISSGYRSQKDMFYEQVKPVYIGLADLLLKQAELSESSQDFREQKLRAARDVMESLKKAELQNFFQDECVIDIPKKMTELNRTPEHTAVIYPILLPDRIALLLILPDRIKQISVPGDSEEIREWAGLFRERLETFSERFKFYAKKFYDCLIRPIESELTEHEIDTLIVVPDSVLRTIPFAALHDGQQFLIEKYAVVTIPAVTLTVPQVVQPEKSRILLGGISESAKAPLPFVEKEVKEIAGIRGQGTILLNKDFTNKNLTEEFMSKDYSILHLSTHGRFSAEPENTYLMTFPDARFTMDNLEKLIRSGAREHPLELLVLSACQTAMGDEQAALGLAGIAVKAGAESAVATLWSVGDEIAYMIMTEFYRQIKSGATKAHALRNAQMNVLANQKYRHPGYWSPFLLIGNWL